MKLYKNDHWYALRTKDACAPYLFLLPTSLGYSQLGFTLTYCAHGPMEETSWLDLLISHGLTKKDVTDSIKATKHDAKFVEGLSS